MRLLKLWRAARSQFDARPAPDASFYAIGDLHGRADLLRGMLQKIERLARPGAKLVFVGDYVDRGDHSREVLALLRNAQRDRPDRVICLMGNHERMLLNFLDKPAANGAFWLCNGGAQTLASFGLAASGARGARPDWRALRDDLRAALGETETWLRGLPLIWQSGNVVVVHAGADPGQPLVRQREETLLWGHREFETRQRDDGIWVVHGHTITEYPVAEQGRIPVDTGAYATGRLTAAFVDTDTVTYLSYEAARRAG